MPEVGEGGSQVPQERWGPGLIRDRNLHLHISRPPHSSEFQKHFSKPGEKNKEEQANLSQMVIVQIVFSFPGIERTVNFFTGNQRCSPRNTKCTFNVIPLHLSVA